MSITEVVGGILIRSGTVLACRRAKTKHLAGYWEFPGGKLESAENHAEALVRELFEELSMKCSVGQLVATSSNEEVRLTCYKIVSAKEPILSDSHDEFRWLPKNLLDTLDWAPLDVPVVSVLKLPENDHLWEQQ